MYLYNGMLLRTGEGVPVIVIDKERWSLTLRRLDTGDELPGVRVGDVIDRITSGELRQLD